MDKAYHFLEYVVLGILAGRVIRAYSFDFQGLSAVTAVTLFCLIYGAGDEFHQWFVPGRWATVGDVLADTVGGWAGGKLYFFIGSTAKDENPPRPPFSKGGVKVPL